MLDPHVDESAEIDHVPHSPFQSHTGIQVLHRQYVAAQDRRGEILAGISTGTDQLFEDVEQRERADAQFDGEFVNGPRLLQFEQRRLPLRRRRVTGQSRAGQHRLRRRVALRVNGAPVQRILPIADAQETGRLLKSLRPQSLHLFERFARDERTVLVPMGHDTLRQRGADTGDVGQKGRRGGVYVHAHPVDHALDHAVQRLGELGLVDVVLVHPHTNRAGIDLDQLRERILHPPGDGDRAPHTDVHIGQFRPGQLAGAVDAGPGLTDDEVVQIKG